MPTESLILVERTKSWKEFELICKDVLQAKYHQEFEIFGTGGESQKGIDIVSKKAFLEDGFVAVQCKNYYDTKTSRQKFKNKIAEDVKKAGNLGFPVSRIIFMTALNSNAELQEYVRNKWPQNTPEILFCFDFGEIISGNTTLVKKHYPHLGRFQALAETSFKSNIQYPKADFYGREGELLRLWEILSNESNHAFIYGPGGYGKTELVKRYCQLYRKQYSTIIFTTFKSSLLDLITDDSAIKSDEIQRKIVDNISMEDDETYFARKLAFLEDEAAKSGEFLIIIDDFNNIEDDKLQEILSSPLKIIFTTRLVVYKEYYGIKIEPIDSDNARNKIGLFCNFYRRNITQKDEDSIIKIVEMFKNHTYLIKLVATKMNRVRIEPDQMYETLIKAGFSTDEDIYREILRLFNFESLNKRCLSILYLLTYIPLTGIKTQDFYTVNHYDNYEDINYLCDYSWIEYNEEEDIISLHPIMIELVEKNKGNWDIPNTVIEQLINGFSEKLSEAWFAEADENLYSYDNIILYILERFTSYSERTAESVAHLADFCYITAHYKECFEYTQKIFNYCLQNFGESDGITVKVCIMFIDRCYNLAAFNKSILLAESLLATFSEIENGILTEQKIELYRMLSRNYRAVGRYEEAKMCIDKTGLWDMQLKSVVQWKLKFEDIRVRVALGDYREADDLLNECIGRLQNENLFPKDSIYYSSIYQLQGCIYNALRLHSKALHMYRKAEQIEVEHHKYRLGIVCSNIYVNIGDTFALLGDDSKAKSYYSKTLNIRDKYFNKEHPMVTDVMKRIEFCNTPGLDRYNYIFSPSEWK